MGKFMDTPVTDKFGNPDNHKGSDSCVYDGEPGWPKREGGDQMPEVTYDNIGGSKYNKD